jgi:hypothetical protein
MNANPHPVPRIRNHFLLIGIRREYSGSRVTISDVDRRTIAVTASHKLILERERGILIKLIHNPI